MLIKYFCSCSVNPILYAIIHDIIKIGTEETNFINELTLNINKSELMPIDHVATIIEGMTTDIT